MSNMFRVSNPFRGNIELDCEMLNSILAANGINSEIITKSNVDDSEWIVQVSGKQREILEKKKYVLEGSLNNVEYCLHFSPLQGARPSSSLRSQEKVLMDQFPSFSDMDDQNSAGNLGAQSQSWYLQNQRRPSAPVTNADVDDEERTVLVRNVPNDLDPQILQFLLENDKLSGGGKIQNLRRVENSLDVEVTFENMAVIGAVLKRSPLKISGMTFPVIKKPIINRAREELEEQKEDTIEVLGVPADMDLEMVKLYFENNRKSGGGKITEDLIRDRITGTVLITFVSSEDAMRVVRQGEHITEGLTLGVNRHQGSTGKEFFLSDVKRGLNEDSVVNFLEAKAKIGVKDLVKMDTEDTWIVYCNDIVNFSQVQQLCKVNTMKVISDRYPKISPVPACDTVLVKTPLQGFGLNEETIKLYFGSQDVKYIRKLSAEQFLVTFKNSTVVPEVCQTTHKIMDAEVQVMPYYKNSRGDGNSEDYELDSPSKLEWMKKYHSTVEKMLRPHVKPIWSESNGQLLKIALSGRNSRSEGLNTLEEVVKKIHEETMTLSGEMMQKAEELIKKETPNAIVSLDSVNKKLQIVAFGTGTISHFKEKLGSLTSNESLKISMDPYKISLLFAENFTQEIQENYPGIRIESGNNKIIIKGNVSNFTDVENEIYKFLNQIQCTSVQLPENASLLLKEGQVEDYVDTRLKSKNCKVSWEIQKNDSVIVYSLESNQLQIASCVFKSSIKALDFGSGDPIGEVVMQKKKWEGFLQRIQLNYTGLFYFDEKTRTGVTIDREEERINYDFKNFFQTNVRLEKSVPLEKTFADYLKELKMNDIDDFCREFGTDNPVTMTVQPDNQLFITASEENMGRALEFLRDITKGFDDMKKMMEYMGVKNDRKNKMTTSDKSLKKIFEMPYANQMIQIHQGDMTQLLVDAIVNAANKEMEHGGGVAKAIVKKGGHVIQTESKDILKERNVKLIEVGDAIVTSGGSLPCKHVIHTVGPIWSGGNSNEKVLLSKAVKTSLKLADNKSLASIAFPAISAGSYKYPLEEAVNVMASTVKRYLDKNSLNTNLRTISFVDTRPEVMAAFQSQIAPVFSGMFPEEKKAPTAAPPAAASASKTSAPSKPAQSDNKPTKALIVKKDELEKVKADIIVNSISQDLDFSKGKLSTAILQSAGKEMQHEFKKYSVLNAFQVIDTKGYKLHCKNVFHISLPYCKGDAEVIITKYMDVCLTAAENHKATSIAFPCLGTGDLKYPPAVVAKGMLRAAYYHLNKKSTSLKEVFIIIYPTDNYIFKAFESESKGLKKIPGINMDIASGSSSIEMQITESDNPSKSRSSTQSSLLSAQGVPAPITKTPDLVLGAVQVFLINGDLLDEQTDAIVHCTDVKFGLKGAISRCLSRRIGADFTKDCNNKGSEMVKNHFAVTQALHLRCNLVLHLDIVSKLSEPEKILEACFSGAENFRLSSISLPHLATDGKTVPLDEMASAMVGVLSKFKGKSLKQVNVVFYQAKTVATFKNDLLSAQGGTLVPTKMTAKDLFNVATLQTSDAEYKKVQKEFLGSLQRTATIKSIEKINNEPLKIQVLTQLEKMKLNNPPNTINERNLWHGTQKDTIMKICRDGFDRGYCGHNGTALGEGVYFAVHAPYSDNDRYSPKDANGSKHMFMCRVCTGEYVLGKSGMRVLPNKPNNSKYDSAVDNLANPNMFIIFSDVQAYPAYHIIYC